MHPYVQMLQVLTSRVILLNISQNPDIIDGDEVDRHTFPAESTTSTYSVQIVFTRSREVIINDQRNLLDVDTSSPDVRGNQYSTAISRVRNNLGLDHTALNDLPLSTSEFSHDRISFLLHHFSVHTADSKVRLSHLFCQPVDLASGVTENDRLRNSQSVIQITKRIKLPVFLFDGDEELLDSFKSQFITLYEDPDRVGHKLGSHFEDIMREGSGDNNDLGGGRKVSVDVVNLVLETLVEEFVRFVKNKHL